MICEDGYVTSTRTQEDRSVSITQICGIERSRDLCMLLARAGIAAGAVTILFMIAIAASFVGFFAKKTMPTK